MGENYVKNLSFRAIDTTHHGFRNISNSKEDL